GGVGGDDLQVTVSRRRGGRTAEHAGGRVEGQPGGQVAGRQLRDGVATSREGEGVGLAGGDGGGRGPGREHRHGLHRERRGGGGGAADRVGEHGLVQVAVLSGGGRKRQRVRGGPGDGAEGGAAVGADLPLHRGTGVAVGRGRKGDRLPRGHRGAGG